MGAVEQQSNYNHFDVALVTGKTDTVEKNMLVALLSYLLSCSLFEFRHA